MQHLICLNFVLHLPVIPPRIDAWVTWAVVHGILFASEQRS